MKTESVLEKIFTSGELAVTSECGPPRGAVPEKIIEKAKMIKGYVDAVNVTDNQTAMVRMSRSFPLKAKADVRAATPTHAAELVVPRVTELVERLRTAVKQGVDYHPYLPREDGRLPMSDFGDVHRYNVTGLVHDMWGFPSDNPKIVYGLLRHIVDKIENNVERMAHYKTFYLEDAETVLVSFGSSARSALHIVESLRSRGHKIGLLELQTLWPFPKDVIRQYCNDAATTVVVEMNMGQVCQMVKTTVKRPERVFLANRIDGGFITPTDIKNILRLIKGKGV